MTSEDRSFLSTTSAVVAIVCTLAGSVIAYLTLAATARIFPFQDRADPVATAAPRTVAVYKAGGANGVSGCDSTSCAFVGVELRGFPAGTSVRCSFDSSVGGSSFLDATETVGAGEVSRFTTENFFGNPGGWVSATCDGVRAELNPW